MSLSDSYITLFYPIWSWSNKSQDFSYKIAGLTERHKVSPALIDNPVCGSGLNKATVTGALYCASKFALREESGGRA